MNFEKTLTDLQTDLSRSSEFKLAREKVLAHGHHILNSLYWNNKPKGIIPRTNNNTTYLGSFQDLLEYVIKI